MQSVSANAAVPAAVPQAKCVLRRTAVTCSCIQQHQFDQSYSCDPAADQTSSRRGAIIASMLLPQISSICINPVQAAPLQLEQQQQLARHSICLADVQADYDRYAPSYDQLDGGAASSALGFPELRQQLLQQAYGSVLEVGVGTGLNLPMYSWSNITRLTGVDLSAGMLQEAAMRVQDSLTGLTLVTPDSSSSSSGDASGCADGTSSSGTFDSTPSSSNTSSSSSSGSSSSGSSSSGSGGVPVRLIQADVAQLPFPDNSFDVVTDTFSLCVFPEPQRALREMLRVLKPGGSLLLLEHTRSDNPVLGSYQGATRKLVAPISKGCDWGQDVPAMVAALPACQLQQQQRHLAGTLISICATKLA